MSSSSLEQVLGSARQLADRRGLPTSRPRALQRWNAHSIDTVFLGKMLAQVSVTPQDTDQVTIAYYGDEHTVSRLTTTATDGVLHIQGEVPFVAGPPRGYGDGSFEVHTDSGTTMRGSYAEQPLFSDLFPMAYRDDQGEIISSSDEIDLARGIMLAVTIPTRTSIKLDGMIGAIGIGPNWEGDLDYFSTGETGVFAYQVGNLQCLSFGHNDEVRRVAKSADVEGQGDSKVTLGSVSGKLTALAYSSSVIQVEGGSTRSIRATAKGGSIHHGGSITGSAWLRVRRTGSIFVGPVSGTVDAQVRDAGSITANGRTYGPHQ